MPISTARATTYDPSSVETLSARAQARSLPRATPRFAHQFRWAAIGNLVYAAAQYGMLVALARIASPVEVGQYALALAIAGPVIFVCNLQLRALLASDAGREASFADYWGLRLLTAPVAWLIISALGIVGGFDWPTVLVIIIAGVGKSLETLSDVCHGASQRDNRLDLVGKSLTLKGPLSLVALGLATWISGSLLVGLLCLAIVWVLQFLLYDWPNVATEDRQAALSAIRDGDRHWNAKKRLLIIGLPLGASIALATLIVAIPNILVARRFGEMEVGIYAALASLAWAGIPFINAMGQSAMAKLGELHVSRDHRTMRATVGSLAAGSFVVGLAGLTVAWIGGDELVAVLYGPEFSGHQEVLLWLMAAATVLYVSRFPGDALTAMRCVRVQLVAQGTSALAVIVGGMWVLPDGGLVGIAQVLTLVLTLRLVLLTVAFLAETASSVEHDS